MMQFSDLQASILLEGLRDYQSMWELAKHIRRKLGPSADADRVRRTVLQALRPLVEGGYAEFGQLARVDQFSELTPWSLRGKSAIDELERKWIQLGRDPEIGELAWLQLTSAGEEVARQLESQT